MFNELENGAVRAGLSTRGYSPDVVTALVPYGAKQLQEMNELDDRTFGRYAAGASGLPEANAKNFNNAYDAMRQMARTNPTFAANMAERYKQDPNGYKSFMSNLSKAMISDPNVSKKVGDMARANNAGEMIKMADNYEKNPVATLNALSGGAPTAPKPAVSPISSTVTTGSGGEARPQTSNPAVKNNTTKTPSKGKAAPAQATAKAGSNKPSPAAASTISAADSLTPGEVLEPTVPGGKLTPEQAKSHFEQMMKDPNNELATEIRRNGLEGDIIKKLDTDPGLVRNFDLKFNRDQYLGLLKKDDKQGFMKEFSGPDIEQGQGMQAGLAGGIGDLISQITSMFGGTGGSGGGIGGLFGNFFEGLKGIFGKLFGAGGLGVLGSGTNLTKMINNPDNRLGSDPAYLATVARQAQENLKSNDPTLRAHGQKMLGEMQITDRGQLHELQQGRAGISHVGFDYDERGRKVAHAYVKPYENIQQLTVGVAANDPSVIAPKKVAGSDVTAPDANGVTVYPVETPKIETRPLPTNPQDPLRVQERKMEPNPPTSTSTGTI